MCIFLALPTTTWYILWSNRDEQVTRATADEVSRDTERKCQYVKDLASWGTRLAVHDSWVYAVLLNAPGTKGVFQTRGQLPLAVMKLAHQDNGDLAKIITQFENATQRNNYNSCILVIGWRKNWQLIHYKFSWNASTQQLTTQREEWSLFVSSPTLYTPAGHTVRWAESKNVPHDIAGLKTFLTTHHYDPQHPYCITEEGVATKSMSIVCVGEEVTYELIKIV